jgi:hypothetical protein
MEKSSKRGKIPQTDWPHIMARYEAGETLASIARTYDCSAPAISYIVSRSREKPVTQSLTPPPTEPQLIKALASDPLPRPAEPPVAPTPAASPPPQLRREPAIASAERPNGSHEAEAANLFPRNGTPDRSIPNGATMPAPRPNPAPAMTAEPRQKLHLSLGNSNGHGGQAGNNGNGHVAQTQSPGELPNYPQPAPRPPQNPGASERVVTSPFPPAPPRDHMGGGRDLFEGRPAVQMPREDGDPVRRGDNGAFIDQQLRSRVDGDIAAFLAAFDAALAEDTHESRFGLREATDRLLRAGARTRIELERLEARVPLTPRDSGAQIDPGAWRHR